MRSLRRFHTYLGVFFAPLLLFFVGSGLYQVVDRDRLKDPGEAELFFSELLKHDLSLTNVIASDFSMLNGRLARHYNAKVIIQHEPRDIAKLPTFPAAAR